MNEPNPPLPAPAPTSKTSALAIWSLVLGIFSMICFCLLTSIPGIICGHMAFSRVQRSGGALGGKGLATAGLVLGYMSIGLSLLLMPIAIPNFVRARSRTICVTNLRQIESAKQQWALENKKSPTDVSTFQDLAPYLAKANYGTVPAGTPACPAGGTYTIGNMQTLPTCTIPGHQLEYGR